MAGTVSKAFARNFSLLRSLQSSLREPLQSADVSPASTKYGKTAEMWKKIFFFCCVPSIVLCGVNVILEEHPEPPEFRPYEHLRIRTRPFPWGDGNKSLFHNPHTNALPDGYESH